MFVCVYPQDRMQSHTLIRTEPVDGEERTMMLNLVRTMCPRSSDLFYIVYLLYKTGHYFLDIQYEVFDKFNCKSDFFISSRHLVA